MKDLLRVLAAWSSKFMDVAAIGANLAADRKTLASYISVLQAFYIVESIPAWHKTDYDRIGKMSKLFMADTGMMAALLNWKTPDFADDADKVGKAFETFAYNELAVQIDAAENAYQLYHYRDKDKREIDFLIERDDRHKLAVEIKSGTSIRKSDFRHIEWFRDNLSKGAPVIGVILYTGDDMIFCLSAKTSELYHLTVCGADNHRSLALGSSQSILRQFPGIDQSDNRASGWRFNTQA